MTVYTRKPFRSLSAHILLYQLPVAVGVTHAGPFHTLYTVLLLLPCFPGTQGSAESLTVLPGCLPETAFIAVLPCLLFSQRAL